MELTKSSCEGFLESLASKAPAPGGGGAAALVGAAGVALGNMVGSLTVGKKKYAAVEADARSQLMDMLPEDMRPAFRPFVDPNQTTYEWRLVKAADKLSAHIKCIEELRAGNQEFASAAEQTRQALTDMHLPELDWFLEHCLDSFGKNLDQLE